MAWTAPQEFGWPSQVRARLSSLTRAPIEGWRRSPPATPPNRGPRATKSRPGPRAAERAARGRAAAGPARARLAEELEHLLTRLVGQGQHAGARALEDLGAGQGAGLGREVGIADLRLAGREV